jgi:Mn-dependent DtxR family transcriptional regulator
MEEKILNALGKEPMTISGLAAALGKERHTVAKYLESMQSQGLVTYKTIGKAKLYAKTASPLLNILSSKHALTKEVQELLKLAKATIRIKQPDMTTSWSNKTETKKCHEQLGNACMCKTCPVEKSFTDGKTHTSKISGKEIISKPIVNEHGKTIAVFEVVQ